MTKVITIFLFFFSAQLLQAQEMKFTGSQPPNPEVLQLITDYQRASTGWKTVTERDNLRKSTVVSKGYFYHGHDGAPIDFTGLTNRQIKNELQVTEISFSDIILHQYENLALVTYKSHSKGMDKGKPFEGWTTGIVAVTKENGEWKVTADIIGKDPVMKDTQKSTAGN
jgi:ketosteroid isomerase-like protein